MRCPVCKAENAPGLQCRRCKADLGDLFALEDHRAHELAIARFHLSRGHGADARPHIVAAHGMRADEESTRLQAMACLLAGDYRGAWSHFRARGAN